jgi:hypothetical protein
MKYTVHCGDVHQVFAFESAWTGEMLNKRFDQLLRRVEVAPGLVLRDENGKLWRPRVAIELDPVT